MTKQLSDLKILYAATPEIALPTLQALSEVCQVVAVLCNPDRPVGRGRRMESPPIKQAASELGIPVLQFETLRTEQRRIVSTYEPEVLISFASGYYFGPMFLSLFPLGAFNVHPSLLPLYRGPAPIQSAIRDGVSETGISVQYLAQEIDSGDLLAVKRLALDGTETSEMLANVVAQEAPPLVISVLKNLLNNTLQAKAQEHHLATYTHQLTKEDGVIVWQRGAKELHAHIRAMHGWPRATTTLAGERVNITAVYGPLTEAGNEEVPKNSQPGEVVAFDKKRGLVIATGSGLLYVTRLQVATGREMESQAFVNGRPDIIGSVLGT